MKKVLCIDDSLLIRTELKKLLEKNGYQVLEADNGKKALDVLNQEKNIDLIFCDVNMPEMNGIEFVRNYFANVEFHKIPVIMLTTEGEMGLKEEAKKYGVKGWIIKPFTEAKINPVLAKFFPK